MQDPGEKPVGSGSDSKSSSSPEGDPSLATGPAPQPEPDTGSADRSRPSLGRVALIFYGVLLGVAALWSSWAGTPLFFASAADAERGIAVGRDLGVGLLGGGVTILVSQQLTRSTSWGERLAQLLASVLGRLSWPACIGLALLSGVAEEAFFRGALQPRVGLIWASLLFGLAHFVPSRDLLPWTAFSIAAGLGFGVLFDATGNLLAPITAHALINAVNLRFLSVRYAPAEGTPRS